MKEKDLISKWLDHDLTDKELEAFKKLDAYKSLQTISETASCFKSSDFDTATTYKDLSSKLYKQKPQISLWKTIAATAAIIAISVTLYYKAFTNKTETYIAENATKTEFVLPDASEVILNAGSSISYSKENWTSDRTINLEGEAYFKVEKGQKFSVNTTSGKVTVLGTQFNVKDRATIFEVVCFEGRVAVTASSQTIELTPGKKATLHNGKLTISETTHNKPDWTANYTQFKSTPIKSVLDEIERQFDITITTQNIDTETVYTGTISHTSLQAALEAISIPLQLEYNINSNSVILKK